MSSVVFVLVGTRAAGNVGAVCRVAKAFGFPAVRLVAPAADPAADEARWLAHGAEDVLAAAGVFADLPAALADCHRAAATTARPRHWNRPVRTPGEAAAALVEHGRHGAPGGPYAVVFGPEDRGLTNDELGACDEIVSIPLPPATGATLSLPHAASIVAWELAGAGAETVGRATPDAPRSARPLDSAGVDRLVGDVSRTLDTIGFRPRPDALRFRGNLRDFLARARPTEADRVVLQGILAQVGKWRRRLEGELRRGER